MKKLIEKLLSPFVALAVWIDDSRRINEDGRYDRYWARKNAKERKREANKR